MSTQERLQAYQQQIRQLTAQERQLAGQLADLEAQLQTVREQRIELGGAVKALAEEVAAQRLTVDDGEPPAEK